MGHVQRALDEMYSSPLIVAIKSCSVHEQILLRAIVAEFRERGVEDALYHKVYDQHVALCRFEGMMTIWGEMCKQGRIHGETVADGWAGAVMQKKC